LQNAPKSQPKPSAPKPEPVPTPADLRLLCKLGFNLDARDSGEKRVAPAPSKDVELAKGVHARAAPAVRDTLDRLVKEMQAKQQGVDDLMKRLDSNKDGKLGRKELSDGLRSLGVSLLPSELDEVMKVFDKDGTGNVDYVEFYAVIREWKATAPAPAAAQTGAVQTGGSYTKNAEVKLPWQVRVCLV
jgi:hypothetical protein